jgi:protein subunit release factor B
VVHKIEEIKSKEIATQKDIDALKEQIKLLGLEQERQKLQAETNQKKFWTEHKQLRSTVADMKTDVAQTASFLKTKVAPAIVGGIREVYFPEKKKGEAKP